MAQHFIPPSLNLDCEDLSEQRPVLQPGDHNTAEKSSKVAQTRSQTVTLNKAEDPGVALGGLEPPVQG